MAYRRRQGITRASTFKDEIHDPINNGVSSSSSSSSPSSLAAKAIRASTALRDSSFSLDRHRSKEFAAYEDSPKTDSQMGGFWGVLAQKAKSMLEDDGTDGTVSKRHESPSSIQTSSVSFNNSNHSQSRNQSYRSNESVKKADNRTFQKGLDAITTSLNQLGDTFEKAFEEGRTIVENKTADIIQETRKLQTKRQGNDFDAHYQADNYLNDTDPWQQNRGQPRQPQTQANHETQLKASRDVAMATAAKAKLLLRELKTTKADLAFAKERCSQLEEENKMLRENRDKGDHRDDEDLIRLQLETLLAEKARLAGENSVYARENRFLREIVEYHQLTMQDVVYLDEGSEQVSEVYPIPGLAGTTQMLPTSPRSASSEEPDPEKNPQETEENSTENQAQENETALESIEEDTNSALKILQEKCVF